MFYSQEGDDGSRNDSCTARLSQWHDEVACTESCAAMLCERVHWSMTFSVCGHKSVALCDFYLQLKEKTKQNISHLKYNRSAMHSV